MNKKNLYIWPMRFKIEQPLFENLKVNINIARS